jgi:hypothetical protein
MCALALKHLLQLWQRGAHVGTPWLVCRGIGAGDEAEEEFGVRVVRDGKLLRRGRNGEVVLDRHSEFGVVCSGVVEEFGVSELR